MRHINHAYTSTFEAPNEVGYLVTQDTAQLISFLYTAKHDKCPLTNSGYLSANKKTHGKQLSIARYIQEIPHNDYIPYLQLAMLHEKTCIVIAKVKEQSGHEKY